MSDPKYLDAALSTNLRVADLLTRMTLEEKLGQTVQWSGAHPGVDHAIEHCHVGSLLHVLGGPLEELRKKALQHSRLKIPVLFGIDAIHGNAFWPGATVFPTQLAQACAFDEEIVRKAGEVTAVETAATGSHWVFSPVFCMTRDLRWGRVDETFGEDPFLIGQLGAALVKGLQGEKLSNPKTVAACAKHYAGYGETQGGRDASEAVTSRRRMLGTFLPPFLDAVKAGCRTFMTGYQSLDGVPCTANHWLMKKVLRDSWGFEGMVVTDWDNVGRMVREQRVRANLEDAAVDALNCENDMIMMTEGYFEAALKALQSGRVKEETLDKLCSRILALKFDLGLFENLRVIEEGVRKEWIATPEHLEVSLEASRKTLVLLKNEKELLPLQKPAVLGLFGPMADDAVNQLGDWSNGSGQAGLKTLGHPKELIITAADGFKKILEPLGYKILRHSKSEERPILQESILEILETAALCDIQIAVVGDTIAQNGETCDRADMDLDAGQLELLHALKATGKPLVVILISGKPLTIPWIRDNADAVIQAFNPGYHGGQALAELFAGIIEPWGHLPVSFARHVGQQPVTYDRLPGWHTDHYCDMDAQPLWAFGEGLTYTQFEVGPPLLDRTSYLVGESLKVSAQVKNSGKRAGRVLLQAYVKDMVSSVTTPDKLFKGYASAVLQPSETLILQIEIPVSSLALANQAEELVVEAGEFELMLGLSSRDQDLQKTRFMVGTRA